MTPDQLLLTASVALPAVLAVSKLRERNHADLSEPISPPIGRRGPIDNALHPFREPLPLGNATIEFYEQHMRFVAMSGGYKTSAMAAIARYRIRQGRPVVIITGGDSDQLEAEVNGAGGWVIRPHESDLKFNAFEGSPEYLAQSWACLFPTNSEAKVYHSAFELAALTYFESTSDYSVTGLKNFVLNYDPPDDTGKNLWKGMKEGYVAIRLGLVERAFGDWLGQELSVLDCVRRKVPLMFVLDASVDQDLNRFSAALVWQAVNYAVLQSGPGAGIGLDCIVDELARLPVGLIGTQVRTWRRNLSHLVLGTHSTEDFDPILHDLIHITCFGTMVGGAVKTRADASKMTWETIHPTNFGTHAMIPRRTILHDLLHLRRRGAFWVIDQERVQKVYLPTWTPLPDNQMKRRASMHGLNATAKHLHLSTAAATQHDHPGAVPRTVSPSFEVVRLLPLSPLPLLNDETDECQGRASEWRPGEPCPGCVGCERVSMQELYQRLHGPPEMPAQYRTKRLQDFWERHYFPFGALDDAACWRVHYRLAGKGQRPELEFEGKNWTAYDLALALNDIEVQQMDEGERASYLAYVKLHTKTGSLSCDHRCEKWRETRAKLCIKIEHLDWEDKLVNSELHWQRRREAKERKTA